MTKEEILDRIREIVKDYEDKIVKAGGEVAVHFISIEDGKAMYMSNVPVKNGEVGQRYTVEFYPIHPNYDQRACEMIASDLYMKAYKKILKQCGFLTLIKVVIKARRTLKKAIKMYGKDVDND